MLKYLPNVLTFSRLVLALPLGILILHQEYGLALAIAFLAGITDALDGFAARRLNAFSQFGAALDPVADKVLISVSLLCFAQVELIPWAVAAVIVGRDLIIVAGALCYRWLIGPFDFAPTRLSKSNMLVQICFCVLILVAQVLPEITQEALSAATVVALFIAVASGVDYVLSWSFKAVNSREKQH
jgi:cardiolipin synthase